MSVHTPVFPSISIDETRAVLAAEHDDLDCAIGALLATGAGDDLLIRRLKKRKLQLKDALVHLMQAPARAVG